uniref:Hint domain-containing protein n=1 Tax=Chromera velia CCMP2878 TaxID=1169474 RepID=A0A0G4I8Y3_9ALVE|eukprot:Cvel_12084.t1-p1 / transcript=Cvel_12084.t1 / gene=Cvel_12084 / organism=Chromera_velia_CCMP2878 / gene_product=hypothetical protein / transcript_product=hypothetical protein / location=Cvel_scaffold778:3140-8073(-) / protein_length=592 / sequence_SO=supercontig / SO=protein_coding / is_pseudo=false
MPVCTKISSVHLFSHCFPCSLFGCLQDLLKDKPVVVNVATDSKHQRGQKASLLSLMDRLAAELLKRRQEDSFPQGPARDCVDAIVAICRMGDVTFGKDNPGGRRDSQLQKVGLIKDAFNRYASNYRLTMDFPVGTVNTNDGIPSEPGRLSRALAAAVQGDLNPLRDALVPDFLQDHGGSSHHEKRRHGIEVKTNGNTKEDQKTTTIQQQQQQPDEHEGRGQQEFLPGMGPPGMGMPGMPGAGGPGAGGQSGGMGGGQDGGMGGSQQGQQQQNGMNGQQQQGGAKQANGQSATGQNAQTAGADGSAPAASSGGGGSCFPSFASVIEETSGIKSMEQLEVGDRILTVDSSGVSSFSPVAFFAFRIPAERQREQKRELGAYHESFDSAGGSFVKEFRRIETVTGHSVTVTSGHFVPVVRGKVGTEMEREEETVRAGDVKAGDFVGVVQSGDSKGVEWSEVVAVTSVRGEGLFAPVVLHGERLVVDGAIVSQWGASALPFSVLSDKGAREIFRSGQRWILQSLYPLLGPQRSAWLGQFVWGDGEWIQMLSRTAKKQVTPARVGTAIALLLSLPLMAFRRKLRRSRLAKSHGPQWDL